MFGLVKAKKSDALIGQSSVWLVKSLQGMKINESNSVILQKNI
jgi:hypothetical protein